MTENVRQSSLDRRSAGSSRELQKASWSPSREPPASLLGPGSLLGFIWINALCVFSPVTDRKKCAFAVFGFRNKIDLAGPARTADHRDAKKKKNGGEAQPSSARIFFLDYGRPRRPKKCRFWHTLTRKIRFCIRYRLRTEKSFFAHVLSYGRKKIDGPQPPRPRN